MGLVSKLENDLIPPNKWEELYNEMPINCKEVVDSIPQCMGIGKNEKYGWFIMGSGQGPALLWTER